MPSKDEFLKLMKDASAFSDEYRENNIDPAHRRADNAYHSILENESDYIARKRSAIYVPKVRDFCTRWVTTVKNAFYTSDDMVTLSNTLYPDYAKFTNEVINVYLKKHLPTSNFLSDAADAHVKYGNAVGKTGWEYRAEKVTDTDADGLETTYEAPEIDRPFFELIPFEDVQYDYRVISSDVVQDSPFWRQWIPMYVTDVEYKFKTKEWKKPKDKNWKAVASSRETDSVKKHRQGKMADPQQQGFGSDGTDSAYHQVYVVENYFRIGGTDWTFLSIADDFLITDPVRTVDKFVHKKRPYALSQFAPEAFRSYSDGLPEKLRHMQALINAQVNMRLDNQNICINRGHIVKRGAGVQLQSLLSPRPGMVTLTDDMEAIKWMEPMDVTASAYQEQTVTERIIEEIAGQSQNRMGVDSSDRQSATEAAIKASSAGEHEAFVIKNFVESFMEPLLTMMVANIVELGASLEVLNDAALSCGMMPDTPLVPCELVINAGMGVTNKEMKAQKIGAAIDRAIQLAPVAPQFIYAAERLYRDWIPLLGMKNVDSYFPPKQGAQAPMNAGGLPVGGPSPASPENQPPPPGISPELSETAGSIPALGGFARGMLQ